MERRHDLHHHEHKRHRAPVFIRRHLGSSQAAALLLAMGKKRGAGAEAAFESGVDDTEADALGERTRAWKAKHPSRDYVGMPLRRFHLQQSTALTARAYEAQKTAAGIDRDVDYVKHILDKHDGEVRHWGARWWTPVPAPSAGGRGAAEAGGMPPRERKHPI